MTYNYNRKSYSNAFIQEVWEKAHIDPRYDHFLMRRDDYGNLISRFDYGERNSVFGWEIDHIIPVSMGGNDLLTNLRPLQWKNNVSRPEWYWG